MWTRLALTVCAIAMALSPESDMIGSATRWITCAFLLLSATVSTWFKMPPSSTLIQWTAAAVLAYGIVFGQTWLSWIMVVALFFVINMMLQPDSENNTKSSWTWKDDVEDKPRTVVCNLQRGGIELHDIGSLVNNLLKNLNPERDQVVLRVESGGGKPEDFGLAAENIRRLVDAKINVIVCVDRMAGSGGYMLACAGNKILASPWATIGSVGVIGSGFNLSKLLELLKIDVIRFISGRYKVPFDPFAPMTEESRTHMQEKVERIGKQFVEAVTTWRPAVDSKQIDSADTWTGKEALALHLVDELKTYSQFAYECSKTSAIVKVKRDKKKSTATGWLKDLF